MSFSIKSTGRPSFTAAASIGLAGGAAKARCVAPKNRATPRRVRRGMARGTFSNRIRGALFRSSCFRFLHLAACFLGHDLQTNGCVDLGLPLEVHLVRTTMFAKGPGGAFGLAVMRITPEFLPAGTVIGFALIPCTPGGSGRPSVTGPANPLRRLTSTLTEIWLPFFKLPPPGTAALRSIGAAFTVTKIGVEAAKSVKFCGAAVLFACANSRSAADFRAAAACDLRLFRRPARRLFASPGWPPSTSPASPRAFVRRVYAGRRTHAGLAFVN